jgi:pimeloyl-ACP methyl ester carboxylesterase
MALDDVGAPDGVPLLYLHGTPDSRLARHPDDGLAAAAGVRLLAVDRPGYGTAPLSPLAVLAPLVPGGSRFQVMAWSGGALDALALAASPGEQVAALHVVGGLVPAEAFADPAVRAAAPGRVALLDMATDLSPAELAPMLAPFPCDRALALDHQEETRDPAEQARLAAVPGGVERMADALVEAVRDGLAGVERDLAAQTRPLGLDLDGLARPVHLWYGEHDPVAPPAFGRWYASRLPQASLHVVPGAGHFLPFTHWAELLAAVAAEQHLL